MEYKNRLLQNLITQLRAHPQVRAVWEGGSAANRTSDQYSDIDICILATDPSDSVFEKIETTLKTISPITHTWHEPKSIWPELTQKVYFLKDAPKHFFVDVAVFPENSKKILDEFMQLERHGAPVVHFDDTGTIQPHPADKAAFVEKHRKRLTEMLGAFPVYRTEVFKELDRGHAIDAFAFYQGAMLRPLVEALGILHRPFQFDFGLRYLERTFPPELSRKIEQFLYVRDVEDLRKNATEVEKLFYDTTAEASARLLQSRRIDAM